MAAANAEAIRQVVAVLLQRTAQEGPDTNLDGRMDAADLVAARRLPASAVTFRLVAATPSTVEGGDAVVELHANSPVEALAGYAVRVRYNPQQLSLRLVEGLNDPYFGEPDTVRNEAEIGMLTLEDSQLESLDEPTGTVRLARLTFVATIPGQAVVTLLTATAEEIGGFERAVAGLESATIEVQTILP
jgi:hypothetical protein